MEEEKEMTLREYLSMTQDDRFEEELTRPRVEIWPDEWSEWIASHRQERSNFSCYAGGHATAFCPIGYH
jgi:hypothetical protein